ncbi:predicted protein [Chaetoceros tenuissimus]|uniref:Uncharacterized protein n=1 Tax=Chaetoceros tenuissimus TaxID=426638 RepID=A0AAD3CRK2_9STRA|nr:predicted protein [Chaetoceros tenuissimus]
MFFYDITPIPVYIFFSNHYHHFLEYIHNLEVDPDLIHAVHRGVVLGVMVLTFFILFPGEPMDFSTGKETIVDASNENTKKEADQKHAKDECSTKEKIIQNKNARTFQKTHSNNNKQGINLELILRVGMYIFIVTGGIYTLNNTYGISVKDIFKYYFPKEAAVLGI